MRMIDRAALRDLRCLIAPAPRALRRRCWNSRSRRNRSRTGPQKKSAEDKDYKAAVERLPDQKFDPWRNMR